MKILIIFALAFTTVWAKDLYSHSIEVPMVKNEGRIVNGKIALKGQFYYQAGIFGRKKPIGRWCSGSLIGHRWILTSSYCVAGSSMVKVFLGATQRLFAEQAYNVTGGDIIPHPYWNPGTLKNDIALLRIPETRETGTIGIVKIPSNNNDQYISDLVVISGWGQTQDHTQQLSNNLRYAVLTVSPAIVCEKSYPLYYNTEEQVCVATPNLVSACDADNGGPLVLNGLNLQIGVFSFGSSKGCELGHPIVFTRVSYHLLWIQAETGIGQ